MKSRGCSSAIGQRVSSEPRRIVPCRPPENVDSAISRSNRNTTLLSRAPSLNNVVPDGRSSTKTPAANLPNSARLKMDGQGAASKCSNLLVCYCSRRKYPCKYAREDAPSGCLDGGKSRRKCRRTAAATANKSANTNPVNGRGMTVPQIIHLPRR